MDLVYSCFVISKDCILRWEGYSISKLVCAQVYRYSHGMQW